MGLQAHLAPIRGALWTRSPTYQILFRVSYANAPKSTACACSKSTGTSRAEYSSNYRTMLAPDPTIDLSTYFGLYNHDDEIQATARIVRAAAGLPMLEHHPIFPEMLGRLQAAKDSVAEISRLAVGYRHAALSSTCATKPGILAVRAQEPACDSVGCCSREATCTHPQPPLGCPATRYWAFDSLLR